MDKKAIETLSVNAVRDSIVTSDFLDQFIADNDKEPSWDGFVYIYEDNSKKKDKLKGRMAVQVKGKECDDFSRDEISYSMSIADLRNYLYDGGAILFVVYISKTGQKKIYYSELTPIKLRFLVGNAAKKQKSKTVKLKTFPNDGNKKATIFLNCWQNCKKQSSFVDAKLHSLDELEKMGILEGIIIPFEGAGKIDPKTALLNNEVYIYANIKGSNIPQPLELIPKDLITKETISAKVSIDDKIFYDEYSIIRNAKTITFQIGNSFTLSFSEPTAPCIINYKNSSKLRDLATDLNFLINYIEHGYFELNGVKLPFDTSGADFSNFDIENEKARLEFAKRSVKVLDMLNCKEDIDFSELKGEDFRNLERLAIALIDKEPVCGLKPDLPSIMNISVGKLKFTVLLKQNEAEKGKYLIFDFFKSEIGLAYENEAGEMIPISQYAIYHTNDFLEVNNLRADLFLPSFQNTKGKPNYERGNWFLLDLLSAYDKSGGKRKDLLKAAKEFATWIKNSPEYELDYQIKILNYYQVVKRERSFNIAEISEIWNIAEDNSVTNSCKVGAYLLLGQQTLAKHYFAKMTEKEQEDFITFPIYYFWNTEEKTNG